MFLFDFGTLNATAPAAGGAATSETVVSNATASTDDGTSGSVEVPPVIIPTGGGAEISLGGGA